MTSSRRWALMHELRDAPELTLDQAVARLSPCDLVLVEGYKRAPLPKLEIHRGSVGKPWLHPDDPAIIAIASDIAPPVAGSRRALRAGRDRGDCNFRVRPCESRPLTD